MPPRLADVRSAPTAAALLLLLLLSSPSVAVAVQAYKYRPVVLMHGLLASAEAMSHAEGWIYEDFGGKENIYVLNCEVGNGRPDSLEMPMNEQVDALARCIQADPVLRQVGSFNLIGHSQGGLLTRGYVERYNHPRVHRLLSWAGPHGGQYGVPDLNALCPDDFPGCALLADFFDLLVNGAWTQSFIQKSLSFATYWRDPYNVPDYLKYSAFLADINNDRAAKNATYKKNIEALDKYLLLYSSVDTIVIPRSSPWFQYYAPGQESKVLTLEETPQYKENWLGLRTLDQRGALLRHTIPCPHQDIPRASCRHWYDVYSRPLLNDTIA